MIMRNERLWISVVTMGLVLNICTDRGLAQSTLPVPLTLNINLQLTKLHPGVTGAKVYCDVPFNYGGTRSGYKSIPIVDRGYSGTVAIVIDVPQYQLADPGNRSVGVHCRLRFMSASGEVIPTATATQPQGILPTNVAVVATGSVVAQSKSVTFPNTAP